MNTLFEIANLNAIYIDAADRDDVADKIYLKTKTRFAVLSVFMTTAI